MELTYHEGTDGLLYPDLKMKEQEDYELGKYGNLRWNYLRTQKRALFQILLMKDRFDLAGTVGVVVLNVIVGGIIGGFALVLQLISGVVNTIKGTA